MTVKATRFQLVPLPDVVRKLRDMADRAERGEVRSFALCGEGQGDGERTTWSVYDLGDGDVAHLICSLERLKLRLLDEGTD